MDDHNIKPGVGSLMFAIQIHTLQTYLGKKVDKKPTLIQHKLVRTYYQLNMLSASLE